MLHSNNILLNLFHVVQDIQGCKIDRIGADSDTGILVTDGSAIKFEYDSVFWFKPRLHGEGLGDIGLWLWLSLFSYLQLLYLFLHLLNLFLHLLYLLLNYLLILYHRGVHTLFYKLFLLSFHLHHHNNLFIWCHWQLTFLCNYLLILIILFLLFLRFGPLGLDLLVHSLVFHNRNLRLLTFFLLNLLFCFFFLFLFPLGTIVSLILVLYLLLLLSSSLFIVHL